MGFADESTQTLETIRENLLRGLDRVAEHLDAGTFDVIAPGKSSPPSQSGHLTLILLQGITAELARRNGEPPS